MSCPHCEFSFDKLKEMQGKGDEFYTMARGRKLKIADVDEHSRKIRMQRSTGKTTWPLDFEKLKDVHDKVHAGLELDRSAIEKEVPTWGSYVTALLHHLKTEKDQIVHHL